METTVFLASLLCTACPPGEYEVAACTDTLPTVCWPCNPGHSCVNGSQRACARGLWSGAGSAWCEPCEGCGEGLLLAVECTPTSGAVCAPCPKGYGCDGSRAVAECARGSFSLEGVCVRCPVNYTTKVAGSGWLGDCFCESAQRNGCDGCAAGSWFIGDACRACPAGYECDGSQLRECAVDTYSQTGRCVTCVAFAHTAGIGAASEAECVCDRGWMKSRGVCSPCAAGTVFNDSGACVPCEAGEFCLGKSHHEPCPADMYSPRGAAICTRCRPDSECAGGCVDAGNCTCVSGFIDVNGECWRCPAGTQQDGWSCAPCGPGLECQGGSDVRECDIGAYSPGNLTQCLRCAECPELTTSRCNRTHDSVCHAATYPFGIISIRQRYATAAPGDVFRVFAMVYASAIPRSQVVRFCDSARCVECFQGLCPERPQLFPAEYELVVEVRSDVGRLSTNIEALTQSEFLQQTAAATMGKVTEVQFQMTSSVIEHRVICPERAEWDGQDCIFPSSRTWIGLGVASARLITLGACGYSRQKARWLRVSTQQVVTDEK